MAKLPFNKLGIKLDNSVEIIEFNNNKIEIKKYLPIQEKMVMVSNIINLAADENKFYNPMKLEIFSVLEIIENYTNINFTEKQKDDPAKLYDSIISSGLNKVIFDSINPKEIEFIASSLDLTVKAIYAYQNSVMGILDAISQDYGDLKLDAESIQKLLADPNNLSLLKDVLTKLG